MIKYMTIIYSVLLFGGGCNDSNARIDKKRVVIIEETLNAIKQQDLPVIYKNFDTSYLFGVYDTSGFITIIERSQLELKNCKPEFNKIRIEKDTGIMSTFFTLPTCDSNKMIFRFADYQNLYQIQNLEIRYSRKVWEEFIKSVGPPKTSDDPKEDH